MLFTKIRDSCADVAARAGVSVALVGRDQHALDRSVESVTALGSKAIGVIADCTVEEQLVALRSTVNERLGYRELPALTVVERSP